MNRIQHTADSSQYYPLSLSLSLSSSRLRGKPCVLVGKRLGQSRSSIFFHFQSRAPPSTAFFAESGAMRLETKLCWQGHWFQKKERAHSITLLLNICGRFFFFLSFRFSHTYLCTHTHTHTHSSPDRLDASPPSSLPHPLCACERETLLHTSEEPVCILLHQVPGPQKMARDGQGTANSSLLHVCDRAYCGQLANSLKKEKAAASAEKNERWINGWIAIRFPFLSVPRFSPPKKLDRSFEMRAVCASMHAPSPLLPPTPGRSTARNRRGKKAWRKPLICFTRAASS